KDSVEGDGGRALAGSPGRLRGHRRARSRGPQGAGDDRTPVASPGTLRTTRRRGPEGRPPSRTARDGQDAPREGGRLRDERELPFHLGTGDHVEVLRPERREPAGHLQTGRGE